MLTTRTQPCTSAPCAPWPWRRCSERMRRSQWRNIRKPSATLVITTRWWRNLGVQSGGAVNCSRSPTKSRARRARKQSASDTGTLLTTHAGAPGVKFSRSQRGVQRLRSFWSFLLPAVVARIVAARAVEWGLFQYRRRSSSKKRLRQSNHEHVVVNYAC